MNSLIFSQAAIFRLQQLGSQYYRYTGERYKLADQGGIVDLLQSSSAIADRKVRSAYHAFLSELDKSQIEALAERGVRLRHPYSIH
jgi:hypothetical protein